MRREKFAAFVLILTVLALSGVGAFAEGTLIIGVDGAAEIHTSDTLPPENTEQTGTTEPGTGEMQTTETDPNAAAETETTGTEEITADQSAPEIVKHPGSEYDKAAGDSVLFTAACSKDVEANWFFNEGIPISQIGSVYPGVSATVAGTIYNSTYPGTKVTISNLTRASSGIKIYVEFTTDYGILKSNEATITVTRGTDKPLTSTPVPTPTPTVAPTAAPTAAPIPVPTLAPSPVPVQTVGTEQNTSLTITTPDTAPQMAAPVSVETEMPVTGTAVDVSGIISSTMPTEGSGYRFTSQELQKWEAPGASLAVAACAIVAVIAILLMLLYSMGAIRLRFLERLVAGKNYVSPDDDDEYED